MILDGAVYRGPSGLAGEIGHVPVTGGELAQRLGAGMAAVDRLCPRCGQECLETLVCGRTLLRQIGRREGTTHPDATSMVRAAIAGAGAERDVLTLAAELIGTTLGPIASAYDVATIIFDPFGNLRVFTLVVEDLVRGLKAQMSAPVAGGVVVEPAPRGFDEPLFGAAERALGAWADAFGGPI